MSTKPTSSSALKRLAPVVTRAYDLVREVANSLPRKPRPNLFGPGSAELADLEHLARAAALLAQTLDYAESVPTVDVRGSCFSNALSSLQLLNASRSGRELAGREGVAFAVAKPEWLSAGCVDRLLALEAEVKALSVEFSDSKRRGEVPDA